MTGLRYEQPGRSGAQDFLELVERGRRGRLRIHLGFGAEVGKTASILREAHSYRARGVDVVCAVVNTRGRQGPEDLAVGLERIAPRVSTYRGLAAEDMDVAAVLARRPAVAVVDDIPHSNAPGSPNAKRWMDVLQLLRSGVSVIGALDVRHLFSLNDAVHRATSVRIYETVPDTFLGEADQVVVVERAEPPGDTPRGPDPIAVLGRRIVTGFETRLASAAPGRRSARLSHRRVAVAVRPGEPLATELLERGAALAARLDTAWFAVILESGPESGHDAAPWEAVRNAAANLGAEVVSLPGAEAPALLDFARRHRIGDLLVARPRTRGWLGPLRRSALHDLIEEADDLDVHVVTRSGAAEAP